MKLRLPPRTVRLRLTLLYGGLFLLCGTALLAITYVLVDHAPFTASYSYRGPQGTYYACGSSVIGSRHPAAPAAAPGSCEALALAQRAREMSTLLAREGIALGIMAVAAIALGWLVAGRALRPLRVMTAAAQRITERNLDERLALAGPDDDLKALADTIDDLLGRLEWAFEAQRRFVANASHELRTPLTMMRTALDVATGKPGGPPPQVAVLAAKVRIGLDRADALLESLLTLARLQRGAAPAWPREAVSLAGTTAAVLAGHARPIAAQGLTVERDLADAPVAGSAVLLTRLTENIIDNAVRHNETSGWIRVATGTDGPHATLVVETGGRVLDQGEVSELAQPFRRLGTDRTGPGTGLGLSIVAAIAEAHGGALDLRARPEGGLRVAISLPLSAGGVAGGAAGEAGATALAGTRA
jgi:signal transduction histidine kinase